MARPFIAAFCLLLAGGASAAEYCSAIYGDTLVCGRSRERVLVEGVYAPKPNEPGADEARERLARVIGSGEVVIQRKGQDKHGRTLGRVFVDGNRVTQLDVNGQSGRRSPRQVTSSAKPRRL